MKVAMFNFNNEVSTLEIHIEDDGRVIVPGEDGPLAEYDSVEQLAEIYAQARDVKPENLKNWVLLQNGDVYSYVLRAGTAGIDVQDVEDQLNDAFASLGDRYHALSIARAKEQVMLDKGRDLVDALVHCTETEIAREVYDAMAPVIDGAAADGGAAEPVEPEDTRSDMEKYIDSMETVPGALKLIATIVGNPDADKAAILAICTNSIAFSNVETLKTCYNNLINDAVSAGIGVDTEADAITVITQTAAGVKDDAVKARMVTAARAAGRDRVNVSVDVVGRSHIFHTAQMISLADMADADLLVRDNVPYIVRFNPEIDATIEAEIQQQEAEREAERAAYEETDVEDDEDPDYTYPD